MAWQGMDVRRPHSLERPAPLPVHLCPLCTHAHPSRLCALRLPAYLQEALFNSTDPFIKQATDMDDACGAKTNQTACLALANVTVSG